MMRAIISLFILPGLSIITEVSSFLSLLPPQAATACIITTSSSSTTALLSTQFPQEGYDDDEILVLVQNYLDRIGFADEQIEKYMQMRKGIDLRSLENLQDLVSAHLCYVPFENMDQHTHPPPLSPENQEKSSQFVGSFVQNDDLDSIDAVPRKASNLLPSLDVTRSLHKIIYQYRGGFCYEVNISFCWLLRQLGYEARLCVADVSCKQEIPAHVIILVDGLLKNDIPVLVDVGFGCPGVCDVILPLVYDKTYSDPHGDYFRFDPKPNADEYPLHQGRFDTVLYRTRIDEPNREEQPMYRFHSKDNLDYQATEFQNGLEYVLRKSPTFNTKRLCVVSTTNGHITLGSNYVKWVEKWKTIKQIPLATEQEWRSALLEHFGMKLYD